jgi:hypothetical protein
MRMTTAGRKPIAYWPETDAEGGVESTSEGTREKTGSRTVGGKTGAEEIDGTLRTGEESLSETQGRHPHRVSNNQQTKQTKQKINNGRVEAREEGDRRSGIQEGKKGGREGGEAPHKG